MIGSLAGADLLLLALAVVVLLAGQLLRAASWAVLAGRSPRLGLGTAFRLLLAGNLANLVIPMRGGELARMWLLARRGGIGSGKAATVVVVERTVDLLVLLVVVAIATLLIGLPDWVGTGAWKLGVTAGVAVGGLAVVFLARRSLAVVAARLAERRGFAAVAGRALARLAEGLGLLRARAAALAALAVLASWGLVLAGVELRLRAFGIELAPGGSVVVLAAASVASSVPVVPAGIGVLEYAVMLSLERLGVGASEGLAFAAASHALTIAVVAVAGGVAFAVDAAIRRRAPAEDEVSSSEPGEDGG